MTDGGCYQCDVMGRVSRGPYFHVGPSRITLCASCAGLDPADFEPPADYVEPEPVRLREPDDEPDFDGEEEYDRQQDRLERLWRTGL